MTTSPDPTCTRSLEPDLKPLELSLNGNQVPAERISRSLVSTVALPLALAHDSLVTDPTNSESLSAITWGPPDDARHG